MKRFTSGWLWMSLGLIGLGSAWMLWDQAFPTASLDFRVSRTDAQTRMEQWLKGQELDLRGCRHAVLFGETTETKNFLERVAGLKGLDRLVRQGINVWYWHGRWFKPEQEEEFSVSLDTQGNLVLFLHTIEETRSAPRLKKNEARALAEKFLQTRVTQHPFQKLRFVEESSDQKPNRLDYAFTWERADLRVDEAPYRLQVTILGDRVGGYVEELKIPENWTREFWRKQELNQLCAAIAGYASIPLYLGIGILFIVYTYQRKLDWSRALPPGWIVLFGIVALASQANDIPHIIANYSTTDHWGSYLMEQTSSGLLQAFYATAGVWILVLIVEPLYREGLPRHLPFQVGLGSSALQYRETLRSIGLGAVFACLSLGYVCAFYVISQRCGAWLPVEVDYSKALSGWIPWVEPLEVGLSASFTEEMIFRALAILLYQKIFRSRWLAILLSAATWAFLHSNYPQMPGYLRGVELTLEGIVWGFLMVRFGILTPLVAHYLYDCWLGSLIIAHSPDLGDRVGAAVVSLWPILLGLWGWWNYARRGASLEKSAVEIQDHPLPVDSESRWWKRPSHGWDTRPPTPTSAQIFCLALLCLAAQALPPLVPLPQADMLKLGALEKSRSEIEAEADRCMRQHQQAPASFQRITQLAPSTTEIKYLLEYRDLKQVAHLFETEFPDLRWKVRYFHFGEKEEFGVQLDKWGHPLSWTHAVPQESQGASLEKEEALKLAQTAMSRQYGVNPAQETLVQDPMQQQENRRDYTFIFERKGWDWGESKLRTSITVQGDEVVRFGRYIHTPEAWDREQSLTGWKDALATQFASWLNTGKTALSLVFFVFMIRQRVLPWKMGFLLALLPTSLGILDWFNGLPWFFSDYATHQPVAYYVTQTLGNFVFQTVPAYLSNALSVSVALGLVKWAFDWSWRRDSVWPRLPEERRRLWFSALALGMLGAALWRVQGILDAYVLGWLFPDRAAYFNVPDLHAALPWLKCLADAVSSGYETLLSIASRAAVAVILYRRFPKSVWIGLWLLPIYDALGARTWPEFAYHAATGELQWLITLVLVWRIWRFHPLAIFLSVTLNFLFSSIPLFLSKGGPVYQWEALPLAATILLFTALAFFPRPIRSQAT